MGSFSNDDGGGNENVKKTIGLLSKTSSLHLDHAFWCISLPLLRDHDVKIPNFYVLRRTQTSDDEIFFLFLNLSAVPKKSTPGRSAYDIRRFQRTGINATMSEKTQIHFKSDVFASLAIVDAKTPSVNNIPQRTDTYG